MIRKHTFSSFFHDGLFRLSQAGILPALFPLNVTRTKDLRVVAEKGIMVKLFWKREMQHRPLGWFMKHGSVLKSQRKSAVKSTSIFGYFSISQAYLTTESHSLLGRALVFCELPLNNRWPEHEHWLSLRHKVLKGSLSFDSFETLSKLLTFSEP